MSHPNESPNGVQDRRSLFSGLPFPSELRSQIYENIFHSRPSTCPTAIADATRGCRCGEGLSRTSKQFYLECRHLHFRRATFNFRSANACEKFLKAIGANIGHLGAVAIGFDTHSHRACVDMDSVLGLLRNAPNLSSLHLDIKTPTQPGHFSRSPLYWTDVMLPAEAYDIQFRALRHPLAELKTLRTLTVAGHPKNDEWEEAVCQFVVTINQKAREEGRFPCIFEKEHRLVHQWLYCITLDHDMSRMSYAPPGTLVSDTSWIVQDSSGYQFMTQSAGIDSLIGNFTEVRSAADNAS
ncbi:hypothetical protein GLAREA_02585 [Glarea lozoyensis ATCC 20868]|uniref:Uncharacterized protein n=1 Tax=Glarea lozoyensis (strain ATCC 20868 / MF5171) TaxID=1116229 RepID=S3CJH5_GLAL2|nr:uncharacterized protein GLAREA_02585 [Glarea lozoyensis ATCC 20868]EPE26672.1 hypothetical protein GLAREA_02585 [Glarea lozoyensis ATCC 20868]